jgi:hypothetical protein
MSVGNNLPDYTVSISDDIQSNLAYNLPTGSIQLAKINPWSKILHKKLTVI